MSALHKAVARAIADAPTCDDLGCEAHMDCPGTCRSAVAEADAVIRVVLAEATRNIEALPTHTPLGSALGTLEWRRDALAVLAALGRI